MLAGARVNRVHSAAVKQLRRLTLDGYLYKCRAIPGWMHRSDGLVFAQLSALQARAGLTADLLEIGAYHGRSAILFGYLLKPGERLFVCDLFEDQPGIHVRRLGRRHYAGLTQDKFAQNYARFHDAPPVLLRTPSTQLLPEALVRPPFRLVHLDGSHEPEVMRQDLATARTLLVEGGVLVCEDDHSVHTPGVPPALAEALASGAFTALCVTPGKTFALPGPDVHGYLPALRAWAAASPDLEPADAVFAGQPVLLLYPLPKCPGPWRGLDRKVGLSDRSPARGSPT